MCVIINGNVFFICMIFVNVSTSQRTNRMKIQMRINLFVIHHGFCAPSCVVYSLPLSFSLTLHPPNPIIIERLRCNGWSILILIIVIWPGFYHLSVWCVQWCRASHLHLMQRPNKLNESFPFVIFINETNEFHLFNFLLLPRRLSCFVGGQNEWDKWIWFSHFLILFPFSSMNNFFTLMYPFAFFGVHKRQSLTMANFYGMSVQTTEQDIHIYKQKNVEWNESAIINNKWKLYAINC